MGSFTNFTAVSGIHGTAYGEKVFKPFPAGIDAVVDPNHMPIKVLKFLYTAGLLCLISPETRNVFADHYIKETFTGGSEQRLIARAV
ncbi:MAG: hypothetical protein RPU52_00400 [Candidatus Sedimenticola sp. (ex Thyasira tokunagai)]